MFEVLDYEQLNEVAAFGGFPMRYPHWRFGMDFEQLAKSHVYGLSKIYEMVINNNPAYAYLMEGNALVEQKLVMAHVLGHVDFFKNNYFFSKTNRRMIDGMANHATRVRRHIDRQGVEKVENFIDACLCLENLIDPMSPFIERQARRERDRDAPPRSRRAEVPRLRARTTWSQFINPPDVPGGAAEADRSASASGREEPGRAASATCCMFLLDNAPLEPWERDILEIVREEAYYFAPQGRPRS